MTVSRVTSREGVLAERGRAAARAELLRGHLRPEQLVAADIAAMLLGTTEAALRKRAERGAVPTVRVGRHLLFKVGDVLLVGP